MGYTCSSHNIFNKLHDLFIILLNLMNISQPSESKTPKRCNMYTNSKHVASLTHAFCKSEFIKREKFIHNIETTYFFV
jgi:hypothetical protein